MNFLSAMGTALGGAAQGLAPGLQQVYETNQRNQQLGADRMARSREAQATRDTNTARWDADREDTARWRQQQMDESRRARSEAASRAADEAVRETSYRAAMFEIQRAQEERLRNNAATDARADQAERTASEFMEAVRAAGAPRYDDGSPFEPDDMERWQQQIQDIYERIPKESGFRDASEIDLALRGRESNKHPDSSGAKTLDRLKRQRIGGPSAGLSTIYPN